MARMRGVVERITYRNEENFYTVARFQKEGERGLVTVVGNFPSISVGEHLVLTGEWVVHREYGMQFKVESHEVTLPATLEGIEKYLGSGLIKGIGPVTAKRLVEHFGLETLTVIDTQPQRLTEVDGIGEKKAATIAAAFQAQKDIQEIMVFLQSSGVTTGLALKIYRQYGKDSIRVVRENPYRLAAEVFGVGFRTADKIAMNFGLDPSSPERIGAGIEYVLGQAAGDGHVFLPRRELIKKASEMLELDESLLENTLQEGADSGRLVEETLPVLQVDGDGSPDTAVYLRPFYMAEKLAAERLRKLLASDGVQVPLQDWTRESILLCEKELGLELAAGQRQAVEQALRSPVVVITGGPGTGKTTIIKVILWILSKQGKRTLLAAPTGRAAKRMTESTGHEAKTIHRLLEFGLTETGNMSFRRNEEEPLDCDVLIIDEASMLDVILFHHLLKAVRPGTKLILVGDADQLPPVGAGRVLLDVIESEAVPVAKLTEVYRQAATSLIVSNAHRINHGELPLVNDPDGDFFWIDATPDQAAEVIRELCVERLPGYYELDPMEDLQVLTPTRRSQIGTETLNKVLQEALNPLQPGEAEFTYGSVTFRVGDKVMQLKNDYQKEVFNGDVGRVIYIDPENGELIVSYPVEDGERKVVYDRAELDELTLSYAISVHKSQGSEYPAIIMPVTFVAPTLRTRNLLYTAITRAKRLVVLVGQKRALQAFIASKDESIRYSGLAFRLVNLPQY